MAPERPMKTYFADFHIHVGRAKDRPVKIAAGKNLTLTNLLEHAQTVKGLDIVGVIDGVCDPVLAELDELVAAGDLAELPWRPALSGSGAGRRRIGNRIEGAEGTSRSLWLLVSESRSGARFQWMAQDGANKHFAVVSTCAYGCFSA
ncbi:hypothetical protein GCM10025858_03170 [Alicyclobacillus sacchari]|uniref:hypothetical protein n=1 Tax=Alicyclobacillus sacchari TaxID=392010 RepID=UPI0023EA2EB5|nr:hypothetical protein [Alicyclobacillus sacchari]GMA55814.1 hypothetical protein GCM10025858_03170 [Alicyclobacillus sacchari]